MNVASFFDVDGDGVIDYEIWANLADTGWSPAYFDNTGAGGKFGQGSGVEVEVAGGELVMRFPLSHLANSRGFRWSLASEWGRYEVISSPAAARDDAPDNDGFVRFFA